MRRSNSKAWTSSTTHTRDPLCFPVARSTCLPQANAMRPSRSISCAAKASPLLCNPHKQFGAHNEASSNRVGLRRRASVCGCSTGKIGRAQLRAGAPLQRPSTQGGGSAPHIPCPLSPMKTNGRSASAVSRDDLEQISRGTLSWSDGKSLSLACRDSDSSLRTGRLLSVQKNQHCCQSHQSPLWIQTKKCWRRDQQRLAGLCCCCCQ